jgi:Bacterial SH3 domain
MWKSLTNWKFWKKRWQWVVGGAVVAWVILLSAGHDSRTVGSLSCMMEVTASTLNVRSGPGTNNPVVGTLAEGAEIQADQTISNDFRQLGPNRWAAQRYLDPMPGSNCS